MAEYISRAALMGKLTGSEAQQKFKAMTGAEAYNEFLAIVNGAEDTEWAQANEWEVPITLGDNLTAAADRLEALLAENEHLREVTKMVSKWVSVSERLPENDECVLALCRDGVIHDMRWNYPRWEWRDRSSGDVYFEEFVTHWMPLPEPPRSEVE